MKLIFIIISLNTGGAQSALVRILKNINRKKFQVTVISLTDKGELGDSIIKLGFPLFALGMKKNLSIVLSVIKLIKLIKKLKPDIIHTWMYHSDLIGGLVAKLLNIKLIIWGIRSADFFSSKTPKSTKFIVKICTFLSYYLPNKIVYNSSKGQEFHQNIGYDSNKSYLIENGVDINKFKPNEEARKLFRKKLNIDYHKQVVGLIARYDNLKNHKGFVEMASYISELEKKIEFVMIGDDIKNNRTILSLLNKKNIYDKFHLLESVKDIENVIVGLDAVVITSTSESFPNVLIESMSCGVPCFSTDVGDVSNIINRKEWVVPINDMKKLANVCLNYFSHEDHDKNLMKKEMIDRTHKKFNSNLATDSYEKLYKI